jgi:hypothetical protein
MAAAVLIEPIALCSELAKRLMSTLVNKAARLLVRMTGKLREPRFANGALLNRKFMLERLRHVSTIRLQYCFELGNPLTVDSA